MANIKDVAAKANVSPSTVSRLLTGNTRVSSQKKERILQAIKDLNYTYKRNTPSKGESKCVGIIIPQSKYADNVLESDPAVYAIAGEIREVFDKKKISYTLLTYEEALSMNREHNIPEDMRAFILLGTMIQQEETLLPLLEENKMISVIVNRMYHSKYFSQIYMDYEEGAFIATEYLINLMHKKIAFICGDVDNLVTCERLKGYRRALKQHNIPFNSEIVFNGEFNEKSGYRIGCEILKQPNPPTAVFAASDLMAIGAQRAFWENGLKLPDDMHMVGFNNISMSAYLQPPLTTIHLPVVEIGREAAEATAKLISEPMLQCIQIQLRPSLVIRESCGEKNSSSERGSRK